MRTITAFVITHVTVSPTRRVDSVFGIGYDDDIEKAMDVLTRTVTDHPLVLDDPEPNIQCTNWSNPQRDVRLFKED